MPGSMGLGVGGLGVAVAVLSARVPVFVEQLHLAVRLFFARVQSAKGRGEQEQTGKFHSAESISPSRKRSASTHLSPKEFPDQTAVPSGAGSCHAWGVVAEEPPLFDSAFLAKLEQLHLLSRKLFQGRQHAERRSRQTGSSLEFADYRNYAPGDDLRSVDWNIYGRLDRLFVKLFEAEQDLHVAILIDSSPSMRWRPEGEERAEPKWAHARRTAAALAYIALANLDRVNLLSFSGTLGEELGFVRGKGQFHAVLDFLKRLPPSEGPTRLLPSVRTFAHRMKRRGLVFVLSDLFDPEAAEALAFLRQQRFETAALQVLHPAEADPAALAGSLRGDLRLVDSETGVGLDAVADGALLKAYGAAFTRFHEALEARCRQLGIGYLATTTATPFEDLVLRVLRQSRLVQ